MVLFPADDWASEEYRGVEEVLDGRGVVQPDGAVVHREEGGEPTCATGGESRWRVVDTTEARRSGFGLCRNCYRPVFSYLADRSDSEVERAEGSVGLDEEPPTAVVADGGVAAIAGGDERLASPTEDVLIASRSSVFHAPTGGGPLCGETADMRRVDRAVLAGQRRPCRECFDLGDE